MCDFCDPKIIKEQQIYFNDVAGVLYPRDPVIFGNVMIIPKRHVESFYDLSDEEIIEMRNLVKKLYKGFEKHYNASGFNLITNNGKKADQHVPHVHWHSFIRSDDEPYSPYDVLNGKTTRESVSYPDKEWKNRKDKISRIFSNQ